MQDFDLVEPTKKMMNLIRQMNTKLLNFAFGFLEQITACKQVAHYNDRDSLRETSTKAVMAKA